MAMLRCTDCGHTFEDGELAKWEENRGEFWGSPCSETVSGCPICKGDYEEIFECEGCGHYLGKEDLYGDFCDDCLKEQIDYTNAYAYLTADGSQYLEEFYFEQHGIDVWSGFKTSFEFREECREWFLRMKTDDKIFSTNTFLKACVRFILTDDFEKNQFADWLEKYNKQK